MPALLVAVRLALVRRRRPRLVLVCPAQLLGAAVSRAEGGTCAARWVGVRERTSPPAVLRGRRGVHGCVGAASKGAARGAAGIRVVSLVVVVVVVVVLVGEGGRGRGEAGVGVVQGRARELGVGDGWSRGGGRGGSGGRDRMETLELELICVDVHDGLGPAGMGKDGEQILGHFGNFSALGEDLAALELCTAVLGPRALGRSGPGGAAGQ